MSSVKKIKILLTGSNGFVGTHLGRLLVESGFEVTAFDRNSPTPPDREFDAIIHLAARVHQMQESDSPEAVERAYQESNVQLTEKLLELAQSRGIRRFIFFSSIKALGEGDQGPYYPEHIPTPQDPYGRSKHQAELAVVNWAKRSQNNQYLILRCPLLYGPGVKANFRSLLNLSRKLPMRPFAAIQNRRSYLSLNNLASLIVYSLGTDSIWNRILHPSDGPAVSLSELTRSLAEGRPSPSIPFPVPAWIYQALFSILGKSEVARRLLGDLETRDPYLFEKSGWKPVETTAEGIRHAFPETISSPRQVQT